MRRQRKRDAAPLAVRLCMVTLSLCLAFPSGVLAQPRPDTPSAADTRRARTLFQQGLSFADRGQWSSAAQRFEQALALRAAPPIRYNLAAALVELGRHVEAGSQLDLVLADAETRPDVRTQAMQLLATVSAQTARLTIRLAGGTAASSGVTVRLDDRELTATEIGTAVRVSPGAYVAVAMRGGRELGRAEGTVGVGESAEVTVRTVPSPAEVAARTPPRTRRGPDLSASSSSDGEAPTWPIVVGVGIGAAALVAGIVIVAVVAGRGVQDPIDGDLDPGVIRVGR